MTPGELQTLAEIAEIVRHHRQRSSDEMVDVSESFDAIIEALENAGFATDPDGDDEF